MFSVFKNINRFANKSKLLDRLAIFFARYLAYLSVVFLIVFSVAVKNLNLLFVPILSGIISRFLITQTIYFIYKKPRPNALTGVKILIPVPKTPALPSGHASFFFGISFMLFFYNIPLAIFFTIASCLIGIARVFCGTHWFSDILAGAFVGFVSALIIYSLLILII